jgi:hypothetical protein
MSDKKWKVLPFAGKWMELDNNILSEGQKPCILPHMWIINLLQMQQTKGRPLIGGTGQGKETKNLNVVDVLTVQEQIS